MKIESIDIKYFNFSGFSSSSIDGHVHIKQLPYLSIVQSKVGSYGIMLDCGMEYTTDEGAFFIAPSHVTQKITHFANKEINKFSARYVFLDVIINNTYHLDDIIDFPVVTDKASSVIFDSAFNTFEASDNVCDRMACLYNIIKHLLEISTEKITYRNSAIYPVIEYIKVNYMKSISVCDMSEIIKMSESNLYSVFKKSTGSSPIKYLNEYRLSMACELLLHTDSSIKAIAEKVGIPDQFYFSKLFKAKYSTSPQKYRKINLY
ncbi:MAG: helix-turn-helix transcriptional regulator [Clostridia bacterium]|nr:helix-turn-helix transcriptional regulator [Clostridia bacterium]